MISHYFQQQPKTAKEDKEEEKQQAPQSSALDKYERQCRDLEGLLIQHEEEARQLLQARDQVIETLTASIQSLTD